jgi:hypothetical protein
MAGKPEFKRSKRTIHYHTSHKSIYEGAETQHVKTNLTASIDGNYTVAADKVSFTGPVAFGSTASLDGDLKVGGKGIVTGILHAKTTASLDSNLNAAGNGVITGSLLVDKNASIDGDLAVGGNTTITGSLFANSNASIDGTLAVGGITTLVGALKAQSTASLDGTLDVGGETDLHYNKLVNVKNVLRTEKVTITTANLSVASRNNSVTLFRASPGDTIYDIVGNSRISWKQNATIDLLRLEVGDLYDPNGFAVSHLASPIGWIWEGPTNTDKGEYLMATASSLAHKTYTEATLIIAAFNASYCWAASLTAGEIDIYVDVMSRA